MSEGTSVGKIFLELGILSDLKSQLENIASKAQGQAKSSFESVGKAASEAMQKPVEKVGNAVEKVTNKIQKTTEECITAAGESLDEMAEALKPRDFEVKAKVTQAEAEPGAPRGPPKYAMAGPDPAKFIESYGKQMESAVSMEDIFQPAQNQTELLKQKMENLTAQITDQREEILKETNELAKLGDEGGEKADKLNRSITAGEGRLISLQQTLMQTQAKYDKAMSAAAQATEKPKEAVASLGEQIKSTLKSAASKGGKSVKNGLGKAFSSMKQNASKSVKDVGHKVSGLGRSIKSAFKSAVLMAGLYAAFRAFRDLIGGALTSNEQFAASLNALKGNLQVAFTPILQVIMPAVNALMSGLALAAQKIAAFTSAVFGKTYAQSVAATKKLKSTSKEAKKAAGAVAGFDQLNNIEKSESQEDDGTNLDALGSVDPNAGANIVKEFSDLAPVIAGFLTQALVKIAQLAPKFVQGAVQVLTSFIRGINANFPMISSAVLGIITAFMDGLDTLIPELVPFGVNVITLLVQAFLTYAPRLIRAGIVLITGLLTGLADKMPELIPMAQDAIRMIVTSLTDNLPQVLQAGIEILLALIDGIIEMIPELMPAIVLVVMQIVQALVDNLPHIIKGGINLIVALIKGITGSLGMIVQHAPEIIESLVKGLVEAIPILLQGAWELVKALFDYLTSVNWAQLGIDIMVALANGVIKGLNTLIGKLNQFDIDVPDWVPVIGGKHVGFTLPTIPSIPALKLPSFAQGGIVSQPTLAMVGDNRQSAEAIAPLHELYGMIKQAVADGGTGLTANEIYTAMLNALNDSKFGSQIRLEGDVNIDGRKFARIIAQAVWDEFVRMGRLKPQTV